MCNIKTDGTMQNKILLEWYSLQWDIWKHFPRSVKITKIVNRLKNDARFIHHKIVLFKQMKYQKHTMQHVLMDKLVVDSLTMWLIFS